MNILKFLTYIIFLIIFFSSDLKAQNLEVEITKNLRCLIYEYLKNKYGDWILYDPGFGKNTYFLWLLPILMFIFGGAIILKKVILKKKL